MKNVLDCAASYSLKDGPDNASGTSRRQVMNYVASNVIKQHQASNPGKWVALAGNSQYESFY